MVARECASSLFTEHMAANAAAANAAAAAWRWARVVASYAPLSAEMCVRSTLARIAPRAIAFSHQDACRLRREAAERASQHLELASFRIDDLNGGLYPEPPYIFALLNQTSLAEAFFIPQVLPDIPHQGLILANIEFLMLPFVGWDCLATGAVVVFRGWPWQRQRAKERAVHELAQKKRSLYMSIEGRRSRDGSLQKYRHGCAAMALASKATIVPVTLKGVTPILPYGEWKLRTGAAVTATLHKVIPTRDLLSPENLSSREERRRVIDALTLQLRALALQEQ